YMPRFSGDQLPQTRTGAILAISDKLDTIVGLFAIGQPPTGSKDPFALRRAALGVLRIVEEKELDLDILATVRFACGSYGDIVSKPGVDTQVLDFLLERFKAWYNSEGISAEVFQSVFALKPPRPLDFDLRVKAVHHFSALPEAQSLAAANMRVSNVPEKEQLSVSADVDASLLREPAGKDLARVV